MASDGDTLNWRVGCVVANVGALRPRIVGVLALWMPGRMCGLRALVREERTGNAGRIVMEGEVVVVVRTERLSPCREAAERIEASKELLAACQGFLARGKIGLGKM